MHSHHGLKRPNKQRNSNLMKLCFSQKLLWASCCWDGQGISCMFCVCNGTAHSVMCTVHVQLQRTAWNVGFYVKTDCWGNYCELRHFNHINLKSAFLASQHAWFMYSYREMHDMWLFIWNTLWANYCLLRFSKNWDISCRWRLVEIQALALIDRMLHVNRARDHVGEPYIPTDSFTFHTVSHRKW